MKYVSNNGSLSEYTVIASGGNTSLPRNTITITDDYKFLVISVGGISVSTPTYSGAGSVFMDWVTATGSAAGSGYTSRQTKVQIIKDVKAGDVINHNYYNSTAGGLLVVGLN